MQYEIKATIQVSPYHVSELLQALYTINNRVMYSYNTDLLEVHEFGITQEQLQKYTTVLLSFIIVKMKIKQY